MSNKTSTPLTFYYKKICAIVCLVCITLVTANAQTPSKSESQKWLNQLISQHKKNVDATDFKVNKIRDLEYNFKLIRATVYTDCESDDCGKKMEGVITPKGDTIPPVFNKVDQFSTGNLILHHASRTLQLSPSNKVVKTYDYFGDFESNIAVFIIDGQYGISNDRGNVILKPSYDYLGGVDNLSRIPARKNDEWIILERRGNNVSPRKNAATTSKSGKLQAIKIQNPETGLWALMNDAAAPITAFKYEELIPFGNGKTIGQIDYLWGLIDEKGEELTDFVYDQIFQSFGSNYMVAQGVTGTKYGLINNKGEEVIPVTYGRIAKEPLHSKRINGLYWVVEKSSGQWGILDFKGQPLTAMQYQQVDIADYDNPKGFLEGKWVELLKK